MPSLGNQRARPRGRTGRSAVSKKTATAIRFYAAPDGKGNPRQGVSLAQEDWGSEL